MTAILVSGLINIETTLKIEGFPIAYQPVRYPFFGVNATVSGVGYNVAKALVTLGDDVRFISLVGQDFAGELVNRVLQEDGINRKFVLPEMDTTAQSVILYDSTGQRMINTDLKNVQEQVYPKAFFVEAVKGCTLAALCNINFSRPLLEECLNRRIPIATDVHTISDLEDSYNRDFMAAADILFMSDEHLPAAPADWAKALQHRYGTKIVVIGLGAKGAFLAVRGQSIVPVPAVQTRPIVSTIGAGDALFSAFIHFYAKSQDPYQALQKAILFASYKIGETGAAAGFLDEAGLEKIMGGR